jgi:hypothetical protein
MIRRIVLGAAMALALATSSVALADDDEHPYRPDISSSLSTPFRLGFGLDVGVPSGAALGLAINPKLDWLRLQLSVTYALAPGGRVSLQLDPMALAPHCPVGLFGDVQAGFVGQGSVPGHSADLPSAGYDYVNLYGGLRLGAPNGFHWNFEVGPTYAHVATSNFQVVAKGNSSGLTIGNPTANGWIIPTFVTGFTVVWP